MIDLKEVIYIHDSLSDGNWKKTKEISKEIFDLYNHKIGFKVTQNYLQSILRPIVEYDPSNYSYRLRSFVTSSDFDKIQLSQIDNILVPLSIMSKGVDTKVEFNRNVNFESLLKAVVAIHVENPKLNILKKINFKLFEQYEE